MFRGEFGLIRVGVFIGILASYSAFVTYKAYFAKGEIK